MEILAPALPLLYLESMVDNAMKGIGEQRAAFRYSVWDSMLRIGAVILLLPRQGMRGFLLVILLSSLFTCAANTRRLLAAAGIRVELARWLAGPLGAAAAAGAAGWGLRRALAPLLAAGQGMQLLALALGGAGMGAVCLAAGWPFGLGAEIRAACRGGRNAESSGHSREN